MSVRVEGDGRQFDNFYKDFECSVPKPEVPLLGMNFFYEYSI